MLIGRSGIIPIAESQDTAGPMTRTVRDAAVLLGVLAGNDPADQATAAARDHVQADYSKFLDPRGLKGTRIGVVRGLPGFGERTLAVYEEALRAMKKEGATLVDEINSDALGAFDDEEMTILLYEFKAGINDYLASLGMYRRFGQRRGEADLVVMGALARGRFAELILGNTAERVLHAASGDVLLVAPRR